MTLHIGDTFDRKGERLIVKRIDGDWVTVEDEEGFAFDLPYEPSMVKREYTEPTDLDDMVHNREGDPAFNGAFDRW